jgi:hypothetical protein
MLWLRSSKATDDVEKESESQQARDDLNSELQLADCRDESQRRKKKWEQRERRGPTESRGLPVSCRGMLSHQTKDRADRHRTVKNAQRTVMSRSNENPDLV